MKIKSTTPFIIKNKILKNKATKDVQDLYTKNYKVCLKKIKTVNKWGNISRSSIKKVQYC